MPHGLTASTWNGWCSSLPTRRVLTHLGWRSVIVTFWKASTRHTWWQMTRVTPLIRLNAQLRRINLILPIRPAHPPLPNSDPYFIYSKQGLFYLILTALTLLCYKRYGHTQQTPQPTHQIYIHPCRISSCTCPHRLHLRPWAAHPTKMEH